MKKLGRRFAAVLTGVVAGAAVVGTAEAVNSLIYPLPAGVNPTDQEALRRVAAALPTGAFAGVLAGWLLASFVGAWVAVKVGQGAHLAPGLLVGTLLVAASILNMLAIPHPVWMWVLALPGMPAAAYAGGRIATQVPS